FPACHRKDVATADGLASGAGSLWRMEENAGEAAQVKVAMLAVDSRAEWRLYDKHVPEFGAPVQALFEEIPNFAELEVHVISCARKPLTSPEKLGPNIWFHTVVVPQIGWLRTGYQGCIRAVRKKVKALQPDIVHGQGTERECGICAALSGVPNVITIHGNMRKIARTMKARIGSFYWCTARVEGFALKRTAGVLCNSSHTESLVKDRAARTWRVPNSLRREFFSAPAATARSAKCLLLNVGAISELKQPLILLNVATEWYQKGLVFELCFVGPLGSDQAYAGEFLDRIRLAEKAGYARYLGTKSAAELVGLFDRAHALIHVSQEESFGLVVAEALARNLKLFAFSVGGIVDIVAGIKGVEMFERNDWSRLSQAVADWLKAGFPRLKDANSIMRDRYHPDAIVQEHLKAYREVLRTVGGGPRGPVS
ncbi:MAG TPA: glycosyltransferase family 4 protein, partial [Verrucomicrobiae bacterium]|nr:glycosyltransferase family 4 protein [Verrucomicrobiae bacterium]